MHLKHGSTLVNALLLTLSIVKLNLEHCCGFVPVSTRILKSTMPPMHTRVHAKKRKAAETQQRETSAPTIEDLQSPSFWQNIEETDVEWKGLKNIVLGAKNDQQAQTFVFARYQGRPPNETMGKLLLHQIMENMEAIVKAIRGEPTLEDIFYSYFPIGLTRYFEFDNGTKKTYYVASHEVDFRHCGNMGIRPRFAFLQPPKAWSTNTKKVFVYFGGSGTGKSMELASSAYLRSADLALVWSPNPYDDIKDCPPLTANKQEEHALDIMSTIVRKMIEDNPELVEMLEKAQKATPGSRNLRLVFGLDEMSSLPRFVRALIRNPKIYAERVAQALEMDATLLDVVFSIAGTGASRGIIGSMPDNFDIRTPSAVADPESTYSALKRERGYESLPPWKDIKRRFPVLFELMQHNARMMSIAMVELLKFGGRLTSNMEEANVVQATFGVFIESNALSRFKSSDLPLLAACALAVHLFQEPVTFDRVELGERATKLDYGLVFDGDYRLQGRGTVTIQNLVQTAGMLVPAPIEPGRKVERPFHLDSAMQLLCVALLTNPSHATRRFDELSLTPFAFEVLATNLIKCAIAASMVVKANKRPTVGDVLKLKLGFFVEENWSLDRCESGKRTKHLFNQLFRVSAIRIFSKQDDKKHQVNTSTHFHEVEAEVSDLIDLKPERNDLLEVIDKEMEEGKGLQFDKEAARRIFDMSPSACATKDDDGTFIPPVTSVAFGSSPLADGYVTFLGTLQDESGQAKASRYTVMIQASKDSYGGTSNIDNGDVVTNGEQCLDRNLDFLFGKNRLFCVASRKEKLKMPRACGRINRNFVGFAVDKCEVLQELMVTLDRRRDRSRNMLEKGVIYYSKTDD